MKKSVWGAGAAMLVVAMGLASEPGAQGRIKGSDLKLKGRSPISGTDQAKLGVKLEPIEATDKRKLGSLQVTRPKLKGSARFLDKSRAAAVLGIEPATPTRPFTLSARDTYVQGRGSLRGRGLAMDAENNHLAVEAESGAFLELRLINLEKGKRVLVECSVGPSTTAATVEMSDGSLKASRQVSGSGWQSLPFLYEPTGTSGSVHLYSSDQKMFVVQACRVTPQP